MKEKVFLMKENGFFEEKEGFFSLTKRPPIENGNTVRKAMFVRFILRLTQFNSLLKFF